MCTCDGFIDEKLPCLRKNDIRRQLDIIDADGTNSHGESRRQAALSVCLCGLVVAGANLSSISQSIASTTRSNKLNAFRKETHSRPKSQIQLKCNERGT